ncbi:MAG: DUF4129 domain-containing protein [Pseudomonadota bacterium]
MRFTWFFVLLVSLIGCLTALWPVHATTGTVANGKKQSLDFVVDLGAAGHSEDLYICRLTHERLAFGIAPITRSFQNVIARDACENGRYEVVSQPEYEALMASAGLAGVYPYRPPPNLTEFFAGNAGLIVVAFAALATLWVCVSNFMSLGKKSNETPKIEAVASILVESIRRDGAPSDIQYLQVKTELETLTSREWSHEALETMVKQSPRPSLKSLKKLGGTLSADLQKYIYQRVLELVAREREPSQKEREYLQDLKTAFDLSNAQVDEIFDLFERKITS